MFEQTISQRLLLALEKLSGFESVAGPFYLAGGTALSLLIGHRKSEDIDLFTFEKFSVEKISDLLLQHSGTVRETANQTVHGTLEDAKVSFLFYPYPLIDASGGEEKIYKIKLASVRDIACMKLLAISQRGEKKDFYDLYEILKIIAMTELQTLLEKKYGEGKVNLYAIARSLTYFEDAEDSPLPESLNKTNWETVKKYFLANEKIFTEALIG